MGLCFSFFFIVSSNTDSLDILLLAIEIDANNDHLPLNESSIDQYSKIHISGWSLKSTTQFIKAWKVTHLEPCN